MLYDDDGPDWPFWKAVIGWILAFSMFPIPEFCVEIAKKIKKTD